MAEATGKYGSQHKELGRREPMKDKRRRGIKG